jgi:hypothetical protein
MTEKFEKQSNIEGSQERIQEKLELAKQQLKCVYGIDNLTTIEKVRLHMIIKDTLDTIYKEGIWSAIAQWLYDLYGIRPEAIPHEYITKDKTTGEIFRFKGVPEQWTKENELEEAGHKIESFYGIPNDFKEYLRRLREKAHNL